MAKTILGIDIGYNSLKLALVNGKQVRQAAVIDMPENLIKDGRIVSTESMGELLRESMKKYNMHCTRGAVVLSNENVFVRSVTMPLMTIEQLGSNLPFEFRDYITDELKDYIYDYAVVSMSRDFEAEEAENKRKKKQRKKGRKAKEAEPEPVPAEEASADENAEGEEDGGGDTMELLAAACPRSLIDDYHDMLRKAGMKLVKAAPTVSCYQSLIRQIPTDPDEPPREYCILDLGYQSIRMYMFRGDRHIVTRVLEVGLRTLDETVAETYNIDIHKAHNNFIGNMDNCQDNENCMAAYDNIAVELMRALNFYRFSNPDSDLKDIWICGGGATVRHLQESIEATLDLTIHSARELMPGRARVENDNVLLQAIGITMD